MAAKSNLRTKLEEELTCAICYQQLDNPKMLLCHHSFCKRCLERYHQSSEQQQDILLCPSCKSITTLTSSGIDALPFDFKAKSIIDMIQSAEISDSIPPTKGDAPAQPVLRPFLDYAATSRARPSLIVKSYGEKKEGFGRLYGLAFGSNGAVVVSDWKQNKLIVFDSRLKYKSTIGYGGTTWFQYDNCFAKPSGLASDKDDNIYVTDRDNHYVKKFTTAGKFVSKLGTGKPGSKHDEFNQPRALTISSNNLLYIADGLNHRIQVFNGSTSKFQFSFGSLGSDPGQLNVPCAVALNSTEDQLFVSDNKNHRIQVFSTQQGAFLRKIVHDKLTFPHGISYNGDGHFLVCSSGANCVLVCKEDGTVVAIIDGHIPGEENFKIPGEARLNENGQIIIVYYTGIVVLSPQGKFPGSQK